MNLMKKCPLFLWIIVSGLLLTIVGLIGSSTIYGKQSFDWKKNPYLSLVFKGIEQGIYPWEAAEYASLTENAGGGGEKKVQINLNEILFGKNAEEVMSSDILEDSKTFSEKQEAIRQAEQEQSQANASDQTDQVNQNGQDQNGQVSQNGQADQGNQASGGSTEAAEGPLAFETVTEDYFNDALFIGDSRTVGMFEYGGLETRAQFYAKTSLTIYGVLDAELAADPVTGAKLSVDTALQQRQFGKIYLMLGINEMGTGTVETFTAQYESVVRRIQELQPQAVIFIQSIMNVSAEKNGNDPIFNNTNILARNTAISQLADQKQIFYLDVNEVVTDQDGNLIADYTGDGVHLKAAYYQLWKELLLQKGIVKK